MSARFWTVERIKRAEDILSQPDGSYTKVADYFRKKGHLITRNSVAGMCTKYGIKIDRATRKLTWAAKGAVTSIKARNAEKKDKAETKRRVKEAVSVIKKIRDHDAVIVKSMPFPPANGGCLSIVGEPKDCRCCGRRRVAGKPYCADHCRLYYTATISYT